MPILIPLITLSFAVIAPLAGRISPRLPFPIALAAMVLAAIAAAFMLAEVLQNGPISYFLGGWAPPMGIEYVADHISAFVGLVITSVSLLVLIATRRAAIKTAQNRPGPFYSLVLLLLTGLTGIVLTGDLFNLFVFLEISSLSSYALIFLGGRPAMLAGFRYLMLGTIGASFYLLGVGFLYFSTGTLNMADMQTFLAGMETNRSLQAGTVLIFVGLGLKMGLVPLHLWLPDAYTYAPSAVGSFIAPVATKVAAYAMVRMFVSVFPDGYLTNAVPIANVLLVLGLTGAIFGSALAIAQTDIRRMLAYSSISQLGLVAAGIGLATPLGLVAALLHIMNHAVMKATLFLAAGAVRLTTGSSNIADFKGLGRRMPLTMAAFSLAAVAMVGVPPFAGFFSKWYLAQAGAAEGQWLVVAIVLGSSLFTAAYLFRIFERAYLQPAPEGEAGLEEHTANEGAHQGRPSQAVVAVQAKPSVSGGAAAVRAKEAPWDVVAPTVFLGVMTIVLGIMNAVIVTHLLAPAVS